MRRKLLASLAAALLFAGTVAASGPETAKVQKAAAQGPVKPQASVQPAAAQTRKSEPKASKSAAAAPKKASIKKNARNRRRHRQIGLASWYGKKFQGHMTASGEPYNMYRLTAAHKELPLGSLIKVTNLRNGKWVIVRVNDRGPYVGNRIVDLSYGAAEILDMRPYGVQRVELELVSPEPVVAGLAPGSE